MMFNALKKWFGRGSESSLVQPSPKGLVIDEDIPRYPPFAKGLPMADVDKVIATQHELIQKIRGTLGFNQDEFERLVLPVISRYASFVHLLPASEAHHHRGAGGLFRHGLEVAFWASQASESVIFAIEGSPKERRNNEPRWRLASCFAGLLHDVGKPLSDVAIMNSDGSKEWIPYSETLVEWAARHQIKRYFLRWRDRSHKRHEQFSLLTVERMLTPEVLEFLAEPGKDIVESMLQAISGLRINDPITKLMLMADRESVARDLKQNRLDVDEFAYGVPVERYVFDALRRLVKSGKWKVNEAGAKVWHLKQGVFVTWKQGVSDIYELLKSDNIPGIPRDADTLADILIERGFALKNVQPEHGSDAFYRYWEVIPELDNEESEVTAKVKMQMLRLESPELVFTTEPPPVIDGEVVGDEGETALTFSDVTENEDEESDRAVQLPNGSDSDASETSLDSGVEIPDYMAGEFGVSSHEPDNNDDTQKTPEPKANVLTNNAKNEIAPNPEVLSQDIGLSSKGALEAGASLGEPEFPFEAFGLTTEAGNSETEPKENESEVKTTESITPVERKEVKPAKPPKQKSSTELETKGTQSFDINSMFAPQEAEPEVSTIPKEKNASQENTESARELSIEELIENNLPEIEPLNFESVPEEQSLNKPDEQEDPRAALSELINKYGDASEILDSAILPVLNGEKTLGEVICLMKEKVVILYPEGTRSLGAPADVLSRLFEAGAIQPDPVHPGRKVHDFKGIKGLLLSDELTNAVLNAIKQTEADFSPEEEIIGFNKQRDKQKAKKVKPSHSEQKIDHAKAASAEANKQTDKKPEKQFSKSTTKAQQSIGNVNESKTKKAEPSSSETEERQNISRLPKNPKTPERPTKSLEIPKKTGNEPKGNPSDDKASLESSLKEIDSHGSIENETKTSKQEEIAVSKASMSPDEAIVELKRMITEKSGRWLMSPVLKEDGFLVTSDKALDKIAEECEETSKTMLRGIIAGGQRRPRLVLNQGQLKLKVE